MTEETTMPKSYLSKILTFVKQINVEVPLFLYMVASFLHSPVFQSIIYDKCCYSLHENDENYCSNSTAVNDDQQIQTFANYIFLYSNLCQTLTAVPMTILLGTFGDRRSRKLSMLVPFVGVVLADVNYIVQASKPSYNVYLLLISDLLFGICGGYSAIIGTIFSYGAEETSQKTRSYRMALLEGTIGLGGTIGYLFSGYLLAKIGYESVFVVELILHSLAFFFIVVFVVDCERETTPSDSFSCCFWIFTYVKEAVLTAAKRRYGYGRRIIVTILISFSFSYLVFSGSQDIMFYYMKYELNWSTTLYGVFRGIYYGSSSLTVLFIYPLLKLCKLNDPILAGIGVISRMVGSIWMCFPLNSSFVFSVTVFYSFNRFASAGMRSIISKEVEKTEQGKIFAAIALIEAICGLIASAIFNALYPATLNWFPGFSYAVMASFMLVPLVGLIYIYICYKWQTFNGELLTSSNEDVFQIDNERIRL